MTEPGVLDHGELNMFHLNIMYCAPRLTHARQQLAPAPTRPHRTSVCRGRQLTMCHCRRIEVRAICWGRPPRRWSRRGYGSHLMPAQGRILTQQSEHHSCLSMNMGSGLLGYDESDNSLSLEVQPVLFLQMAFRSRRPLDPHP